jgi:dipeptidyl aminopeptidase/acylaminoacyl peptidase
LSKRPIALEDLHRFQLASDVQISPDGRKVVCVVKRIDPEKNKYYSSLYMAHIESGDVRAFTGDDHSDGYPRWSPDGRTIAFTSDRDKPKNQVYLIPADGGEARKLTSFEEGGVHEMAWSPDGMTIALLFREKPAAYREEAQKEREEKETSAPVRVHKKMFYRLDGFGYFDEAYPQLWTVDVATGESRKLTDEPHHLHSLAWTPDGSRLSFVADRRDDDDVPPEVEHIWTIPAGGGEITQLEGPCGPKHSIAWSPDGALLAYIGHTDPVDSWGCRNQRVLLIPAGGSTEARDLTGHTDQEVGYSTLADMHEAGVGLHLQWSPDSKTLYFPVSERGDTKLYRVNADGSNLRALTPDLREMGSFSISADGTRFGLQLGNATELTDAWVGRLESSGELSERKLSGVNERVLEEVEMQMPEPFEVANDDDGKVHGWILRPTGFAPGKRYPGILYIHGGPAAQYGGQSGPFHELQWLAANGYVVVFSNPRGSKGYGEAHTSAIKGDWGNKDWQDLTKVADHLSSLPYVDPSRLACMGGSYGGYMTAWAVGHTDRFKCAITDRLVANRHSMSGTCDFPWSHGTFWKGNAWDDPSDLWRCSPLAFAGKVNTPVLIIHSDGDLRCPVSQAEEWFAALRLQRKPVEFVRYPASSSHGLSRNGPPDLRIDRLQRNLAWLDKHLK